MLNRTVEYFIVPPKGIVIENEHTPFDKGSFGVGSCDRDHVIGDAQASGFGSPFDEGLIVWRHPHRDPSLTLVVPSGDTVWHHGRGPFDVRRGSHPTVHPMGTQHERALLANSRGTDRWRHADATN